MIGKIIKPIKNLEGEIELPGDKSISHRAIMLGSLAKGETVAKGVLNSDDCNYTIEAFRSMGISIEKSGDLTTIKGKGLKRLSKPEAHINVGNSGTTMRVLAGILAGQDFEVTLEGSESLSKRPMKRIVEPLAKMNVGITAKNGEYPPLKVIGGKVNPIDYKMTVPSAQVKSAVLFAGLYANGVTTVEEVFKSRDHTERMMEYFGADIKIDGLKISVKGGKELTPREVEIPGDISSASFFMVGAAILKNSKVKIKRVSINPTRSGILTILKNMGAKVNITNRKDLFEPFADIEVESSQTKGIVIKEDIIPNIIDELPIIFVLAALSKGKTSIRGALELKVKETDRIRSMTENLKNMGAKITFKKDLIEIEGVESFNGTKIRAFGDHRTCMAMSIAALRAKTESIVDDAECVNKSLPEFFTILEKLSK